MSEKQPPPKDRTTLYIAIVGAAATILAALIGTLPNLLPRNDAPSPTPIVITATSAPTVVSQAPSTAAPTQQPSTPPASATGLPTVTLPTATATLRGAGITPPPPSPTRTNVVTFLLVNNLPRAMEFFVDGQSATKINSGSFQPIRVPRGTRELKQCVLGSDYADPNNCFSRGYDVQPNPDVWVMFDQANPLVSAANVNVLVLNRASIPQDIFIDNQISETVQPGAYAVIPVARGEHTIQPCAPGIRPPNGGCGKAFRSQYSAPTHFFTIDGESS